MYTVFSPSPPGSVHGLPGYVAARLSHAVVPQPDAANVTQLENFM